MCTSCEVLFFLPSLVLFEITTLIKLSKMQVFHMPGVKRKLGRGKVVMGFRFTPGTGKNCILKVFFKVVISKRTKEDRKN